MKTNKKQINIRLSPVTYQLLELLSNYHQDTKTNTIENAIRYYASNTVPKNALNEINEIIYKTHFHYSSEVKECSK